MCSSRPDPQCTLLWVLGGETDSLGRAGRGQRLGHLSLWHTDWWGVVALLASLYWRLRVLLVRISRPSLVTIVSVYPSRPKGPELPGLFVGFGVICGPNCPTQPEVHLCTWSLCQAPPITPLGMLVLLVDRNTGHGYYPLPTCRWPGRSHSFPDTLLSLLMAS
jgi:hypothetical protein